MQQKAELVGFTASLGHSEGSELRSPDSNLDSNLVGKEGDKATVRWGDKVTWREGDEENSAFRCEIFVELDSGKLNPSAECAKQGIVDVSDGIEM